MSGSQTKYCAERCKDWWLWKNTQSFPKEDFDIGGRSSCMHRRGRERWKEGRGGWRRARRTRKRMAAFLLLSSPWIEQHMSLYHHCLSASLGFFSFHFFFHDSVVLFLSCPPFSHLISSYCMIKNKSLWQRIVSIKSVSARRLRVTFISCHSSQNWKRKKSIINYASVTFNKWNSEQI